MKTLTKSRNRKICGVCGGLAEYIGIDANIARLIVVVLTLITAVGAGIALYIVAALIMPDCEPSADEDIDNLKSANINEEEKKAETGSDKGHTNDEFNSYFEK